MRTVTFQSIFEAVLGRHGLDPFGDAITHDTARALARQITDRAQTAWMMWPWPELMRTEERAYRQVWNATTQYRRVSEDGLPDEVYYLGNEIYYQVKVTAPNDPPIGTLPTSTTYFSILDPVSTFVARDQVNQLPLGQTIGVYASNPSLNNCYNGSCLDFFPSEKGTRIHCGPLTTVFIQHQLGEPEYTMTPYIAGKSYAAGDRVFYTTDGNCYLCIAANSAHVPTDTDFWALVPVPAMFSTYLKEGAYADGLMESTPPEDQIRIARAGASDTKANESIYGLIDDLLEQGQQFHYLKRPHYGAHWTYDGTNWWAQGCCNRWCHTEAWSGDIVHVLSGTPAFSINPPPAPPPQATMIYRPEIDFLLAADGTPSLQAYPSAALGVDTLIIITIAAAQQTWRVDAGAADGLDPGQISPSDYNIVTNNKHYTKVL